MSKYYEAVNAVTHYYNSKFHCLKASTLQIYVKIVLKLQMIFQEMTEFQNSIQH